MEKEIVASRRAVLLVGMYMAALALDAVVPACTAKKSDNCKSGYEYVLNSSYQGPRCREVKAHEKIYR